MSGIDKPYDDHYAACLRTYCTLRIYTGEKCPDKLSEILDCKPLSVWHKKEEGPGQANSKPFNSKPFNAWFYSSRNAIDSRESRRHLDYVLAILEGKKTQLDEYLGGQSYKDIICFWQSSGEQGGPVLNAKHAAILADFDLEISWNLYSDH